MIHKALEQTAALFEPVREAYSWVHRAASILANHDQVPGAAVRRRFSGLLGAMSRWSHRAQSLVDALSHFIKVTRSYWPGLFHCYAMPELPRTNNFLEQFFGSFRHHERRSSGRKKASLSSVLRGSVRLPASAATRVRSYKPDELVPDVSRWRVLRQQLDSRRETRRNALRFRRDPYGFLASLEHRLIKATLPT